MTAETSQPHLTVTMLWPCVLFRYGDEVPEGDERSVSGLLLEQVEFADVLLLNKLDLIHSTGACSQLPARASQPRKRLPLPAFPLRAGHPCLGLVPHPCQFHISTAARQHSALHSLWPVLLVLTAQLVLGTTTVTVPALRVYRNRPLALLLPHAEQRRTLVAALKRLNPRAQLIETTRSRVDIRRILGTRLFDLEVVRSRTRRTARHSTAQCSTAQHGTAWHITAWLPEGTARDSPVPCAWFAMPLRFQLARRRAVTAWHGRKSHSAPMPGSLATHSTPRDCVCGADRFMLQAADVIPVVCSLNPALRGSDTLPENDLRTPRLRVTYRQSCCAVPAPPCAGTPPPN